jgi:hypothetical protein
MDCNQLIRFGQSRLTNNHWTQASTGDTLWAMLTVMSMSPRCCHNCPPPHPNHTPHTHTHTHSLNHKNTRMQVVPPQPGLCNLSGSKCSWLRMIKVPRHPASPLQLRPPVRPACRSSTTSQQHDHDKAHLHLAHGHEVRAPETLLRHRVVQVGVEHDDGKGEHVRRVGRHE